MFSLFESNVFMTFQCDYISSWTCCQTFWHWKILVTVVVKFSKYLHIRAVILFYCSASVQCFDQTYSYCASEGFTKTSSDNLEIDIADFEEFALPTIESGCSELAKFFYCGTFFPQCDERSSVPIQPCKKYCEGNYLNAFELKKKLIIYYINDNSDKCLS